MHSSHRSFARGLVTESGVDCRVGSFADGQRLGLRPLSMGRFCSGQSTLERAHRHGSFADRFEPAVSRWVDERGLAEGA